MPENSFGCTYKVAYFFYYCQKFGAKTLCSISAFHSALVLHKALNNVKLYRSESKNLMIYSSANPEYFSVTATYMPDGYEVLEDDVELIKEIGHGNFGKVNCYYIFHQSCLI